MKPAVILLSSSVASHSCTFGNSIGHGAKPPAFFKVIQTKLLFFLTIILFFFFFSCTKEVAIQFPAEHISQVFIEGMLYPGKTPQIFISKSNPFFSTKVTPQQVFARGAVVKISGSGSTDVLVPDSIYNKFRCRWELFYKGSIASQYGKTYTLEVSYEGKTYTAITTINQQKAGIEKIEYTPDFSDSYGSHDGVIITITDHAGTQDYYRFQMNRFIDTSVHHAHVLDGFINTCVTGPAEKFFVKDIGRVAFSDENIDGQKLVMPIEVSYEYKKGDSAWVFIQSLDKASAEFYNNLDEQLQAIYNPFVEPVFIRNKIPGAIGVFGSAVLSDSVLFIYPRKNP